MKATKRDIYQQLITVPMNPDDHYELVKISRIIQRQRKYCNERHTTNWYYRGFTQPKLVKAVMKHIEMETCHNEEVFQKRILEVVLKALQGDK